MSDWATSLGYAAGDFFPDSDNDDDNVDGSRQQDPIFKTVDEELVRFTETPFTIAARNAQVRKARQATLPPSDLTLSDALSINGPRTQRDDVTSRAESGSGPALTPQQSPRPSTVQIATPSVRSEVIVVSSDSEPEDEVSVTAWRRGGSEMVRPDEPGGRQGEEAETKSEKVLQHLFEENSDFYRKLEDETASHRARSEAASETKSGQILDQFLEENGDFYRSLESEMAVHQARSEAGSSSVQMESMIIDNSTTFDTSSFAPTYAASHYQPNSRVSPVPRPAYPQTPYSQVVHDGYEEPTRHSQYALYPQHTQHPQQYLQPMHHPPPHQYPYPIQYPYAGNAPVPHQRMGYHPAYTHVVVMPSDQGDWHPGYQQPWPAPYAPHQQQNHPSQYSASMEADLSSYRRPKSPRQVQAAKRKADMVLEALKGSSKRKKPKSGLENLSSHRDEEDWSTLKPSRPGPDGTLSLTAAMRRPLPKTRLPQSKLGGSSLAMPLYRTVGSSAEARRRAETFLLGKSSRPLAAESSTNHSSSSKGSKTEPPRKVPKLFRPTPLPESDASESGS